MKKTRKTIITLIIYLSFTMQAQAVDNSDTVDGIKIKESERYSFSLLLGKRREDLEWTINANPEINILSDLDWHKIRSRELRLEGRYKASRIVDIYGTLGFTQIYKGVVRDSDYCGPNRTKEFSRSLSDGEGDDYEFGLGAQLRVLQTSAAILRFTGGYTIMEQNFNINNGVQVMSDPDTLLNNCDIQDLAGSPPLLPPDVGTPLTDLNTRYDASWSGPTIGAILELAAWQGRARMTTRLNLHFVTDYEGDAVWGGRGFSFRHTASGSGLSGQWALSYLLQSNMLGGIRVDWARFESDRGDEYIHGTDCGGPGFDYCIGPGAFNGAEWNAITWSLFFMVTQ